MAQNLTWRSERPCAASETRCLWRPGSLLWLNCANDSPTTAVRVSSRTTSSSLWTVAWAMVAWAWEPKLRLVSTPSSNSSAMVSLSCTTSRKGELTPGLVTPILGAIIADQYLGRYKTIVLFCGVYLVGLLVLWTTALPHALAHGSGLPGFIVAIIIIGFGTGGIKSNVAPLIADQYQRRKMALKTLKTGERVIIDPAVTMQRIYLVFYWCINVGALSLLATPYMEKYIGFWSAFLLAFCMFLVGVAVLIFAKPFYVVRPPTGSIITNAFRAMGQMIIGRNQDAPKPSYKIAHGKPVKNTWDDHFIDEVKRALIACRIFVFYPIFWVAYGQFSGNFVTQGT